MEFYGFDPSWGHWALADQEGNPIVDGEDGDEDGASNGSVKSGVFTLMTDEKLDLQWVEVDDTVLSTQSTYLKWATNTDIVVDSDEGRMTSAELGKVSTPAVQLIARVAKSAGRIQNYGAGYTGLVTNQINLNRELKVSATADDEDSGEETNVPMYWEEVGSNGISVQAASSSNGISVAENGDCIFREPGDYQVRAFCFGADNKKVYSEPVTLTAREPSVLTSIEFDQNELKKEREINAENPSVGIDLEGILVYRDQYGEEMEPYFYDETTQSWRSLVPEINFMVEGEHHAHINGLGWMTVNKPGEYTVSARALDESGKELSFAIQPAQVKVTGRPGCPPFNSMWKKSMI